MSLKHDNVHMNTESV